MDTIIILCLGLISLVAVPITSVTMTQPVTDAMTVQVNTTAVFVCETSGGLPAAQVSWFKDSGTIDNTEDDIDITAWSSLSTSNTSDNLIKVTSRLNYSPSKAERNMRIYCKANNGGSNTYISSRKPILDVQYPPESPPFILHGTSNVTGQTVYVREQTQSMLSCSATGGNPLANLTWNCYNGIITDRTSGDTVTKEITWTASRGQDDSCTCDSTHYNWRRSVSTRVEILYPPSTPTFSIGAKSVNDTVAVIQNKTLVINCTSNSKPAPTYTWRYKGTRTDGYQISIPNIQTSNNGPYTCEAQNTMAPSVGDSVTGKQNSSITVQVLYPPRSPQFRYGSLSGEVIVMNTLEVVEGDSFSVACVAEAEPTPQYQWSQQSGYSQILSVNNINSNQTRMCTVKNTMKDVSGDIREGVQTSDLQVFVMYAPTTPVLSYKNQTGFTAAVTNNHRVIENTTFSVSCSAYSRPSPSYTWSPPGSSISNKLSLTNVKRSQRGVYTCDVSNTMRRTFANTEQEVIGKNSKNFTLDILYAPVVHSLVSEDIVEGQTLMKVCEVTAGNPPTTTFTWTRVTDNRTWQTQTLSIINVSRTNASYYKCTAKNRMSPTVESEDTGEDSKTFFLNVLFSSSIRLFTLNGVQESSIVSENDTDVPVICDVDSNPASVITIEHDGTTLVTQNDTKHMIYSLDRAQCTDAGYYRCIGRNTYNTQSAVKEIRLFVKCSPRPSPLVPLTTNVRIPLHGSATLQFTALAYPEPEPLEFKWYRENNSQLIPMENNKTTQITTEGLRSNLTIVNVTEPLFGHYTLKIQNAIGSWEQTFILEPYSVPNTPTGLKQLDEKATLSSVTLQWTPGFNGGPQQTFVLKYRKIGTQQWTTVNITHHGATEMTHEIKQLSSGTQYEVVLLAANIIGSSTESLSINASTAVLAESSRPGNTGAVIGGAVSGGIACAILIAVVVIIIQRIRTRKGNGEKEVAVNNATAIYTDLQTTQHEYTNMTSEYSELTTRSDSTSKAVPEDAKVYVNLQMSHIHPRT